jgi:hypothetical protein
MARLLLSLALILTTSGICASAAARKTIVLLDFGGAQGPAARTRVLKFLKKTYNVYPGVKLLDACERLGIEMKRGRPLSLCAREIGAVAIVGGTTAAGKLHLVVYSGKTGQPLRTGAVKWGSPPSSGQISEALRTLGSGLSRAPASVEKPRRKAPPPPAAAPRTAPPERTPAPRERRSERGRAADRTATTRRQPAPQPNPSPQPPAVVAEQPVFDPSQIGGPDSGVIQAEDQEPGAAVDVLDPLGGLSGIAGVPYETEGELEAAPEDDYMGQAPPRRKGFERNRTGIEATAGFGAMIRHFDVSKALKPPTYDSGLAMGLRFAAIGRPLAFLFDDWVAGFFFRLHADLSVGLRSNATLGQGDATVALKMGTSIFQVLADMGWEWLVLDDPEGPVLSFSVGFGLQNFSVDWPDPAALSVQVSEQELKTLPDTAYRFALLGVGGTLPVGQRFAGYARANYRLVFGAGEIEDEQIWYGDAFVGGVGAAIGARANFYGFVASVEYGFTVYFYSFSGDRGARINSGLRGAGGAVDQYHTAMLNLGYAY